MNFAEVLTRQFGAEDREVEHLLACEECDIWNSYDGAELERCAKNPVRIESQWISDLRQIGRGLLAAFQLPKRPLVGIELALKIVNEQMMTAMVEQLNRPIFFDTLKPARA